MRGDTDLPRPSAATGVQLDAATRVLIVGSSTGADTFEWHVLDSMRALGCTAELILSRSHFFSSHSFVEKVRQKAHSLVLREPERGFEPKLLRKIQQFCPTVILVLLGNQVSPKTAAVIRKHSSARLVCWCQDQMTTLGRQFLLGCEYDAVFVKDRYMQDLFSRMIRSSTFYYLPEACNPRTHRPLELTERDRVKYGCDVMIAGTLYYYRQEMLRQLVEHSNGIHLRIWGDRPDWLVDRLPGRHMRQPVHGDAKVRAALAAKICLNTLHYAEVNGLNCRAFELAGCGGFQLMTRVPALAEHFEPEVEVATFGTIEELLEKTAHYLRNPSEALAIAERGRLRAHRDHTYEQRLRELLNIALR
jgi:spore maturation protein CgeB